MGRAPCCDKASVKKGPWSPEEDKMLKDYIDNHGAGSNWIALPQKAGLKRCGKSCRLRWLNYLRPNNKHGDFSDFEDRVICMLYSSIGSRWSVIAAQLPGRTDNDIKNYWNTKLKKKLTAGVIPPVISSLTQRAASVVSLHQSPSSLLLSSLPHLHSNIFSLPLASSWLLTSCSLPPAINPTSTNEFDFGNNLVQQYNVQKDGFCIAYGSTEPDAAGSSSEASNYNFSISTSSVITSENSDQSVSYGYYPNLKVEEKENLVPTSSVGCGWSEGEIPEDYGFDEIKRLISTNNITASSFLFDENKVEESEHY